MNDLLEPLQDVFRDVFDDDELIVAEETTAADVDGWDSLMHINLIIAVEKRFGIAFATAEISNLKGIDQNVGTFRQLIANKLERKT